MSELKKITFIVKPLEQALRLDQYLAQQQVLGLSRMRVQEHIKTGKVFVNGKAILQPKFAVSERMEICLLPSEPDTLSMAPHPMELDILYEDDHLLVLNKPVGLVVHPGNGTQEPTLVHALLHHCGDSLSGIGGVRRPGIVHRLDKHTSGVMVVAKNDYAHQQLSQQFSDHGRKGGLQRRYRALVWGAPQPSQGKIESYLGRAKYDRLKRAVVQDSATDAKWAITHYKVLESFFAFDKDSKQLLPLAFASFIECQLETGRTHQIRVHMAHKGHALLGDEQYGGAQKSKAHPLHEDVKKAIESLQGQALHAYYLRFSHPLNGEMLEFSTPLPFAFSRLLEQLKTHYGDRR